MRMCVFLCVLISSLLGMPKNVIAHKVQTMLEYYENVCTTSITHLNLNDNLDWKQSPSKVGQEVQT